MMKNLGYMFLPPQQKKRNTTRTKCSKCLPYMIL